MRRREFIGLVGGAAMAWPLAARAQQPPSASKRLAICSPSEPTALMYEHSDNRYYRALFAELRRLGHIEGQNLIIERYGREKNASGIAATVAEVIRTDPDVIYVIPPGALDFKRGTAKIPLVALTGDPVAAGLVQSLARPGGNLTGVSVDTGPTIYVKRIALLREIFPAMSKLCCIALRPQWENVMGPPLRTAWDAAGIGLVSSLIDPPSSEAVYRDAIAQASRDGANAIMVADNPDTLQNRALIVRLIGAAGIPAMYSLPEFVDEGGLIAYSFDLVELNKRVANDIDAILRGANPGEIPYYQASKFELFVSLKTAKALGLTVPETLLASADKVIE
jgi:putative ABC transport system substrate-binding protein